MPSITSRLIIFLTVQEALNVYSINYEFNLLNHVGVVAEAGGVRRLDKISIASFLVADENGRYQ